MQISVGPDITGGIDFGFDKKVPAEVQKPIRDFISWVEAYYVFPVTLWVDFEYRHYLVSRKKERVGYLFCWVNIPEEGIQNRDDIPILRVPVRTEHYTIEEILGSLIEGISNYYARLLGEADGCQSDDTQTDEVLEAYRSSRVS